MIRNKFAIFAAAIAMALLLAACGGSGGAGSSADTASVSISAGTPESAPNALSTGTFGEVQLVTVDVFQGSFTVVESESETSLVPRTGLSLNAGVWEGTIDSLPLGTTLTFVARAFSSATFDLNAEIFTAHTITTLSGPVTITFRMEPHGVTFEFPRITSITVPDQIKVGASEVISADISGSAGETLTYVFDEDPAGGSFANGGSDRFLDLSAGGPTNTDGTVIDTYTAPGTVSPDPQVFSTNTLTVTNEAQTATVVSRFPIEVTTSEASVAVTTVFNPVVDTIRGERFSSIVIWRAVVIDDKGTSGSFEWAFLATGDQLPATVLGSGTFTLPNVNPTTGETSGETQISQTGYDETVSGTMFLTVSIAGEPGSTTVSFELPAGLFPDEVVIPLFTFDSGTLQGWAPTGIWHITDRQAASAPHSAWAGFEATGTVDDGAGGVLAAQTLTSPVLTTGAAATLQFVYRNDNGCDLVATDPCPENQLAVHASRDGFVADILFLGEIDGTGGAVFATRSFGLPSGFLNTSVWIRFTFNPVNTTSGDNFEGPFIDNVIVLPQ